jgi:hypothetical protein
MPNPWCDSSGSQPVQPRMGNTEVGPVQPIESLILNGNRESLLSAWPLDRPEDWVGVVNEAQTDAEVEALRRRVNRDMPYGRKIGRLRSGLRSD